MMSKTELVKDKLPLCKQLHIFRSSQASRIEARRDKTMRTLVERIQGSHIERGLPDSNSDNTRTLATTNKNSDVTRNLIVASSREITEVSRNEFQKNAHQQNARIYGT